MKSRMCHHLPKAFEGTSIEDQSVLMTKLRQVVELPLAFFFLGFRTARGQGPGQADDD